MTDNKQLVVQALENPQYQWRTLDGIAQEIELSKIEILQIFQGIEEQLIRSSDPDKNGMTLYTTRKHYYKTQDLLTRSLTAASGSIRK